MVFLERLSQRLRRFRISIDGSTQAAVLERYQTYTNRHRAAMRRNDEKIDRTLNELRAAIAAWSARRS